MINCKKEKCRFYNPICEAAYDGCMFGASIQDNEHEKECVKQAFMEIADEMEQKCGNWQELPDTEADKKLRERIMAEVQNMEQQE